MPGWVSDWVAFARPDDILGNAVIFRVDGTPPDHVDLPSLSGEWREHFKSTLGANKAPRIIEFKPIPRTERGKIKRHEL
jgi:acyl-coenzyme A synthetase/AMP-(fatty) acid ligase